jgi:uncharacterized protein (DUF849 family)
MPALPRPALPRIMVAPNGARRTKRDHPNLPMTINELLRDARACQAAGAGGIHAHMRDDNGLHVLDGEQFRQFQARMHKELPDFYVQATSESAGLYTPTQQRAFLADLCVPAVSVAVRELLCDDAPDATRETYGRAGVDIQHILYETGDAERLATAIANGIIPGTRLKILIVHGTYQNDQTPSRATLDDTVMRTRRLLGETDWAVCSFGAGETEILRHVLRQGGNVRVGFENNLFNPDGKMATSNAARVAMVAKPRKTDS